MANDGKYEEFNQLEVLEASSVEISPEMLSAGIDCAADLGVEPVSLELLAQMISQRMVLASRELHLRSYSPMDLYAHPASDF